MYVLLVFFRMKDTMIDGAKDFATPQYAYWPHVLRCSLAVPLNFLLINEAGRDNDGPRTGGDHGRRRRSSGCCTSSGMVVTASEPVGRWSSSVMISFQIPV